MSNTDNKEVMEKISAKVSQAEVLIAEAQKLAKAHGLTFTVEIGDGGGNYDGKYNYWSATGEWYSSNC